ncbi:MAG: octaprenyl-diphosphate synthase [Verrucomicrobiota bacterium]|nr:octaprenyl-diphosphate synthase [Verrucomicrobiota bacterium]
MQVVNYLLALNHRSRSLLRMSSVSASRSPDSYPQQAMDPFHVIAPHLAALDQFMRDQALHFEPEIRDMAAYCLEASGKRLRPTLVFFSGWHGKEAVDDSLVRAAAVVEMVHLATLVHDDIMDRAELRRNRQTASRKYGPDAAVLLGDALFSQALHIASLFPTAEVCRLVSASTRRVCSGEIMQTLRRRDTNVSLADYRRMIDLKTAELFRTSCYLGAYLSAQAPGFAEAADRFGHHLGIAYQIYDDLVDFLGEEQQIGKTLGTDLATGKLTLPLMILLERIPETERTALLAALREGNTTSLASSQKRMHQLGIGAVVIQAIDDELAVALSALQPYAAIPAVQLLKELAALLKRQVTRLSAVNEGQR